MATDTQPSTTETYSLTNSTSYYYEGYHNLRDLTSYQVVKGLVVYLGPVLMLFGTAGNILTAAVVVLSKKLQKRTSSLYILFLAIVDILCLDYGLTEYILVMKGIRLHKYIRCQTTYFLIYFLPMFEGWVIVNISLERFAAVYFPLVRSQFFSKQHAILGLVITLIGCTGLNIIYIIIIETVKTPNGTICRARLKYSDLYNIWGWVDVCFTSVLPFLIMLVCSTGIIVKIIITNSQRKEMKVDSSYKISKTTLTLLIVCTAYLCLTGPCAIVYPLYNYFYDDVINGTRSKKQLNDTLVIAYYFNFFFYVNYAINFYIYCISNPQFRTELWTILTLKFKGSKINNQRPKGLETQLSIVSQTIPSNDLNTISYL